MPYGGLRHTLAFVLGEVAGEEKVHEAICDFSAWYGEVRRDLFFVASGVVAPGGLR